MGTQTNDPMPSVHRLASGELMLAGYQGFRRLGTFKPVRMLGGAQAIRQPWRSLYAHLITAVGWEQLETRFGELELVRWLAAQPRRTLDRMMADGINSPWASSCGRLFDAAAAAIGLCRERARFEAEGAMQLEAAVDTTALRAAGEDAAYLFSVADDPESGLPCIEPRPMWEALLEDLRAGTPTPVMAARFHRGLADVVVRMVIDRAHDCGDLGLRVDHVVLTGGCFQNAFLLEQVIDGLGNAGFSVLTHARVPTNDGGLALGQAAVAAAIRLDEKTGARL